jgi:hypothetical protein
MNRDSSNRFENGGGLAAAAAIAGNGAGWARRNALSITMAICGLSLWNAVVTMRNLRLLPQNSTENYNLTLSLMPPTPEQQRRRLWVVVPEHGFDPMPGHGATRTEYTARDEVRVCESMKIVSFRAG